MHCKHIQYTREADTIVLYYFYAVSTSIKTIPATTCMCEHQHSHPPHLPRGHNAMEATTGCMHEHAALLRRKCAHHASMQGRAHVHDAWIAVSEVQFPVHVRETEEADRHLHLVVHAPGVRHLCTHRTVRKRTQRRGGRRRTVALKNTAKSGLPMRGVPYVAALTCTLREVERHEARAGLGQRTAEQVTDEHDLAHIFCGNETLRLYEDLRHGLRVLGDEPAVRLDGRGTRGCTFCNIGFPLARAYTNRDNDRGALRCGAPCDDSEMSMLSRTTPESPCSRRGCCDCVTSCMSNMTFSLRGL